MSTVRTFSASSRAALSAVVAAAFAVASYLSPIAGAAVMGVALLAFALGWPRLVALPAPGGRSLLLVLTAAAATAAVVLAGNLRYLAVVTAGAVIGSFLLELGRRDGRPRLVDSLAGSLSGVVVVVSGAAWFVIGDTPLAVAVVLTTAGALAAGSAFAAIPLPPWPHALLAIGGATAVGVVAGVVLPDLSFVGAAIGFAAGLLSAALHQILGRYPAAGRPWAALAAAVLPIVVVGVPVYALARFYLV